MEFLYHSPFKGKKLQFMGRVVGLSLCQTPTGIGYDSIGPIIMSLMRTAPILDPQALVCSFKGVEKLAYTRIGAMVHRCFSSSNACWHLSFQVIATFFLPAFSPDVSSCWGQATCMNLGMNQQ